MAVVNAHIVVLQGISCHGACDGILSVTFDETPPDTPIFAWSWPGPHTANTQTITGVCAETYTLAITDGLGTIYTVANSPYTLTEPATLSATITVDTNVTCYGGADGSITITPSGGTGPFTIWLENVTYGYARLVDVPGAVQFIGLGAGSYEGYIEDQNGCLYNYNGYTITEAAELTDTPLISDAGCYGGQIGSIVPGIGGGTPPYTYLWNTGATTEDISNLYAGTYSIIVTDDNGCTKTFSYTVHQNTEINIQGTIQDINSTHATGSILANITGGTGVYITFNWSNGDTTQNISGLTAGDYTLTVTDSDGCTQEATFTVRTSCDAFNLTEFKVFLMRAQCCFGELVKKQNLLIQQGRQDLADCMTSNLMLLNMIIRRFYCIEEIAEDTCWSCTDIEALMTLVKKICSCDCCEGEQDILVTYDTSTNLFNPII